jgi:hypothetical protein
MIADDPALTSASNPKILRASRDGTMSAFYAGAPLVRPHRVAADASGN